MFVRFGCVAKFSSTKIISIFTHSKMNVFILNVACPSHNDDNNDDDERHDDCSTEKKRHTISFKKFVKRSCEWESKIHKFFECSKKRRVKKKTKRMRSNCGSELVTQCVWLAWLDADFLSHTSVFCIYWTLEWNEG